MHYNSSNNLVCLPALNLLITVSVSSGLTFYFFAATQRLYLDYRKYSSVSTSTIPSGMLLLS